MALAHVKYNPGYERLYRPSRVITTGASATQQPTDDVVIISTTGQFDFYLLPNPWKDRGIYIKKKSSAVGSNVTIHTTDSTLFDGQSTISLTGSFAGVELVFDGSAWNIL